MALPSNQNNESIISKLDYLCLRPLFLTPYYSEDEETDIRCPQFLTS